MIENQRTDPDLPNADAPDAGLPVAPDQDITPIADPDIPGEDIPTRNEQLDDDAVSDDTTTDGDFSTSLR
jgi:hypothetical protein